MILPDFHRMFSSLGENNWLRAVFVVVVGLVLVRLVSLTVQSRVAKTAGPHWALVGRKVVDYGGALAVLLTATHVLGINLTALLATAGVATIAIGFAAQTSLSNLIAGFFLFVDRPFDVGDSVEMESRRGVVLEIKLLSTLVRTMDNVQVRWPNEVVLKSTILNYTRFPARRLDLRVGVAYGTDVPRARRVLLEALTTLPIALVEPRPDVVARAFLDSAVELEVRAWVAQEDYVNGRTKIVELVHATLNQHDIQIPFPQITISKAR